MPSYAFVCGFNGPNEWNGLLKLRFAESDAEAIGAALSKSADSYDAIIATSRNGADSCADILARFEVGTRSLRTGDRVLFYFSGHGHLVHDELYLLVSSSRSDAPIASCMSANAIKSVLGACKASAKILILDCCHSGGALGAPLLKTTENSMGISAGFVSSLRHHEASALIAACGRSGAARESEEPRAGVLTHFLCDALTTSFETADLDGDGRLSVVHLINWLHDQIERYNKRVNAADKAATPLSHMEVTKDVWIAERPQALFKLQVQQRLVADIESARSAIERYFGLVSDDNEDPYAVDALARPIHGAAVGLTDVRLIGRLLETARDGSTLEPMRSSCVYTAATILRERRDPTYLATLLEVLKSSVNLKSTAVWRVLWALEATIKDYELESKVSRALLEDILKEVFNRQYAGAPEIGKFESADFDRKWIYGLIAAIVKKAKLREEQVIPTHALPMLREFRKSRRRQKDASLGPGSSSVS